MEFQPVQGKHHLSSNDAGEAVDPAQKICKKMYGLINVTINPQKKKKTGNANNSMHVNKNYIQHSELNYE